MYRPERKRNTTVVVLKDSLYATGPIPARRSGRDRIADRKPRNNYHPGPVFSSVRSVLTVRNELSSPRRLHDGTDGRISSFTRAYPLLGGVALNRPGFLGAIRLSRVTSSIGNAGDATPGQNRGTVFDSVRRLYWSSRHRICERDDYFARSNGDENNSFSDDFVHYSELR